MKDVTFSFVVYMRLDYSIALNFFTFLSYILTVLKEDNIEYLNLLLFFYNFSYIYSNSCTTSQNASSYKRMLLFFKAWWPTVV